MTARWFTLLVLCAAFCAKPAAAQLRVFVIETADERAIDTVYTVAPVTVGGYEDTRLLIRNTGTAPVSVTRLSVGGVGFALDSGASLPVELPPAATLRFTVRFQPTGLGQFSANLTVNTLAVILRGVAQPAPVLTVEESGTERMLAPGAIVNFGDVEFAAKAVRRFTLTNPGDVPMRLSNVGPDGEFFFINPGPPHAVDLAPGEIYEFQISFEPPPNLPARLSFQRMLEVGSLRYTLRASAVPPPVPEPSILIDLESPASARQGRLTIKLSEVARASESGTVDLEFQPAIANATDPAILFPATSSRKAAFQIGNSDVASFAGRGALEFQTGTTAGTLTFTTKLGAYTKQTSVVIAPAPVGIDSAKAARTATGIEVSMTAYDNTRSASQVAFTFYDRNGQPIGAGPVRVNSQIDFSTYFKTAELGGVFALKATVPITGPADTIDSVDVEVTNSAGPARSARLRF